jgi:hypothetical protein
VCFDEAQRLDMSCDLLVGSGWPFGAEFLDENERAQIVVNYSETVTGPITLTLNRDTICNRAMPKVSSPYQGNTKELMLLRLYPNPASKVDEGIDVWQPDSVFSIQVPEGEYTLAALVKINGFLEVINGAPGAAGPVLDHFNTEAVKRYLKNMSEKNRSPNRTIKRTDPSLVYRQHGTGRRQLDQRHGRRIYKTLWLRHH